MNISTNRINHLLITMMKFRFPNIFQNDQVLRTFKMLSKPLDTTLNSKI